MASSGIYIHVPFCRQKCPYCDFYSVSETAEDIVAYTAAVCRNLCSYACDDPVDTIYFGGGTPSLLSPLALSQILETADHAFPLSSDMEITLEVNPATVSREDLRQLRKIGINRLSVGVQSLQARELKLLGRLHTVEQAIDTVEQAAAVGFKNISADLMLAIPGQNALTLEKTLQQIRSLPLTHVSAYLLKIETGTPFGRQQVEHLCPSDDEAADLYLQTVETLEQDGLCQYEISNFARNGMESRHNNKYWACAPYLGIGPSAHACWHGKRFAVPPSLSDFLESPKQTEQLEDDAPCGTQEQLMLGLRRTKGVPENLLAKPKQVERYVQGGFLARKDGQIYFTPKGFLVSNTILADLL